jgi:hypothetical protein
VLEGWWHVVYEDNDEEDMHVSELGKHAAAFQAWHAQVRASV